MERHELSAADIYCKFAAQLDEDGFRLYHAAQRITGFQPYDAFPYEDNRGAFEASDGHTLLRYLEAAHFDAVTWEIVPYALQHIRNIMNRNQLCIAPP